MRFMVIVKSDERTEAGAMPTEAELAAMMQYNEELVKAGVLLDGAGLLPSSRGARVHLDGDKRTVVDGPFAEAKELVAGFWVLEVTSRDEAIEWAKRCPNPADATTELEIRQIASEEDFGDEYTSELREQSASQQARIDARK